MLFIHIYKLNYDVIELISIMNHAA